MVLSGLLSSYKRRNEKTGESVIKVNTSAGHTYCSGVFQHYPINTPIEVTGSYKGNDLIIEKIHAAGKDRSVIKFLSCGNFSGIGDAVAEQLVSLSGDEDFFRFWYQKDPETVPSNIDKDVARRLVSRINNILGFEELLDLIKAPYYVVADIFSRYGLSAKNKIEENPYILLESGADLSVCERLAASTGLDRYDKKRTEAVTKAIFERLRRNGDTKISCNTLIKTIQSRIQDMPDVFILESLANGEYRVEEDASDLYIYSKYDWQNEQILSDQIRRVERAARDYTRKTRIETVEKHINVEYSTEQKAVFDAINRSGLKLVTGFPGTGKTTLLKGLLYAFHKDNPYEPIALCAPTARAAYRMTQVTGFPATTIHRFLNVKPYEPLILSSRRSDASLIVVDESSMLDTELAAALFCSIKNGATVILMGDPDQLPSVGGGNVFSDLLKSGLFETYKLSNVYRQGAKSTIAINSRRIMSGNTELIQDNSFAVYRCRNKNELCEKAVAFLEAEKSDSFLFSPVKKIAYPYGTVCLNRRIVAQKGEGLEYGSYTFHVGDRVIFNRNNYDKGYFNGEDGVITDIQTHNGIYMSIRSNDTAVSLNGSELDDVDLGFALTAHKSQGGEIDTAIIVVPEDPACMLIRELLYVEVTRAKKKVIVLSEGNALEKAILGINGHIRSTGLTGKLKNSPNFI